MAETLNIGGISLTLGGDNTLLKKKLQEVQSMFNQLSRQGSNSFEGLSISGIAATLGITAALYKVVDAFKETINAADDLGKAAVKLGVSANELSKLKVAADKADVSFESLTTSLRLLTVNMQQASSGDGARLFDTLGISVTDATGKMKDSIEVMKEVADKFATFKDGANKTAIAIQLFGRAGADMIPILNQGRAGIEAMGNEAQKTGQSFSANLIAQSNKLNDLWKDISYNIQAGLNKTLEGILPGIISIAEQFKNATANTDLFNTSVTYVTNTLRAMISVIQIISTGLQSVGIMFASTMNAIYAGATGDLKSAYVEMMQGAQMVQMDYDKLGETMKKLWGTDIPDAVAKGRAALKGGIYEDDDRSALKDKFSSGDIPRDQLDDSQKKDAPHIPTGDEISRQMVTITATSKGLNDELTRMESLLGIGKGAIDQNSASWQQYDAAAQAAAQRLQALEQIDLSNILNDEGISSYAEKWDALTAAVHRGTIGLTQYDQMAKGLAKSQTQTMEDLASQTASTLTDIFGQNKLAAVASAIINTAVGVTKALSAAPPPWNFAMAALVAASGAAQIASIRSTTQDGGGSVAPVGGGDASSVNANANAAQATPQETLNVVGIDRNSLFSGDQVRGIAQTLINYQRDGGRVVLD